jgi:hypothetical protein
MIWRRWVTESSSFSASQPSPEAANGGSGTRASVCRRSGFVQVGFSVNSSRQDRSGWASYLKRHFFSNYDTDLGSSFDYGLP